MESVKSKPEGSCENCRVIKWCHDCSEDFKFGYSTCRQCKGILLLLCNKCENTNWSNWSSGNKIVDDFIKECNTPNEILKWIPYNQFSEITYIAKGGFGEIYKAKWNGIYDVALKKLYNSNNITKDFLNECTESNRNNHHYSSLIRLYGISYDSITQDFVMVIGNILLNSSSNVIVISDFGLSQPANISTSIKLSGIHGVVPYIAPEIFLGKQYTPASDIYSLGIIIWVLHSFEEPFNNKDHDANLILDIIRGLRPQISPKMGIPTHIVDLMKKCWDSDPKNRPTAQQIIETLGNRKIGPNETYLANFHRKKYSLLKTMNLVDNYPGTCYTSRYLSFQRVKEHLAKLTLEDSGQNDLSLPTSINDDNIKDFGDKIIALPTLPNTLSSQIP
ncbi:hypothetical protein RclHR1_01250002 [Rhizophagus clarus]|uniref:Protein kinase domain-containing protein n=1 Tax=Rhizophagus clarus TaxID=94130 RepID=A0A2Z6QJQ9_9GLOM|nr:hypothetical protein RclHR1_01250002 [Rhizophagus clarus]